MKKRRTRKPIIAMALTLVLLMAATITVEFCKLPKAEPEGVVNRQSNLFGDTKVAQDTKTATKVKKPGQVKGLKKVKLRTYSSLGRNISSAKITFKKVKGATGYQILIYQSRIKGCQTPLLYEKTTKKTTYTIKNLIPNMKYTIKVRAYTKGKKGQIIYGKTTSIKAKMPGRMKGLYYVCNHCVLPMPPTDDCLIEHMDSVDKVHGELHTSGTYNWK